jgi:uncharacterized 2Fe-2S/4Fe-4S cluster protein (DUF4445 family)
MPNYALAIDLGTTTLAVSLIDTDSGRRLAMTGSMNPQRRFGADVVARLDAAVTSEDALTEMSALVRTELLRLARELCEKTGVAWGEVKQAAIAGNPAMQHILLGLPVRSLAFPPFRPLFTGGKRVTATELDWEGDAQVYVFPMPGGFVGGDTVAFLYGQGIGEQPLHPSSLNLHPSLFLDMGTNGEMALIADGTIWATSAAAGPAFEGGNLTCGMAALPGAISSVAIEGERLKLAVIANAEPVGICGSGAIEAVSELLLHDIIEPGGRLRDGREIPSNLATRVVDHQGETAFVLYRDARQRLLLTQGDIRQIQLAKGAIRAGMDVLAERSCIRIQALRDVVLTGSFGAVLRPEWLKTIGIFDQGMVHISRFTPEGALTGVERALAADDGFESVERLGKRFRVVPLSGTPLFETLFMTNIDFPHP